MIKRMIEWEGFDGRPTSKTFFFNLTEFEVQADMELEKLEERFRKFEEEVINSSESREMTPPEVREMLDLIRTIVKHAYGKRSEDGTRFIKNEEVWNEFVETGGFDAFIRDLFANPERANAFMRGIWPKRMIEEADKAQPVTVQGTVVDLDEVEETPQKEWTDYTEVELLEMSDTDFNKVLQQATKGRNVPFQLLQIGSRRKTGGGTE